MTSRAAAVLPVIVAVAFASRAEATVSISPTTSYDGSYTVSWTDNSSSTNKPYLAESFNGGAWGETSVYGKHSKAFTGRPVGTYSYKIRMYYWDYARERLTFQYETTAVSVVVTVPPVPGIPGAITGPTTSASGAYTLSWTAASGTVTRYELVENGGLYQSSLALSASFSGKTGVKYRYRVRACNGAGCGGYTAEFVVDVSANLTTMVADHGFPSVNVPDPGWFGALRGTPSTDGGSANYDIPIDVPPGRAGMQPSIALTYGSHNGNGIAGVGWALSGSSSIYRCPRTLAQEGGNAPVRITSADRLCIDGKRLVQKYGDTTTYGLAGSEYRTEVDDFARVTLKDADMSSGTSTFDVEEKSGLTSRYAVPPGASSSSLPAWLLKAQFDRQNNCIAYEYQAFKRRANRDEEWVLSRISYTGAWSGAACSTGSDARSVEFQYTSDRPDNRTTYTAWKASVMTARLAAIVTKVGGQPVRRYELAYSTSTATNRSLLSSVKVCAGATCAGDGTQQLPATTFTYQQAPPDFAPLNPSDSQIHDAGIALGPDWRAFAAGDYDGDGTRDTFIGRAGPWRDRSLLLSGGGKVSLEEGLHLDDRILFANGPGTTHEVDIDNDGRSDLVGFDSTTGKLLVASLRDGQWVKLPILSIDVGQSGRTPGSYAFGSDFDGDGLVDIVFYDASIARKRYFRRCPDGAPRARFDCFAEIPVTGPALPFGYVVQMTRDLNGDGLLDSFADVMTADAAYSGSPIIDFQTSPGSWTRFALGGRVAWADQEIRLRSRSIQPGDGSTPTAMGCSTSMTRSMPRCG